MLEEWTKKASDVYHDVTLIADDLLAYDCLTENKTANMAWDVARYEHMLRLRQAALDAARKAWADYILVR